MKTKRKKKLVKKLYRPSVFLKAAQILNGPNGGYPRFACHALDSVEATQKEFKLFSRLYDNGTSVWFEDDSSSLLSPETQRRRRKALRHTARVATRLNKNPKYKVKNVHTGK